MVTMDGLQSLLEQYRYAYHSVDTKPHVIRSAIGDFMVLVPDGVFHLMLEYFPGEGCIKHFPGNSI
jgi:hypothetical protein